MPSLLVSGMRLLCFTTFTAKEMSKKRVESWVCLQHLSRICQDLYKARSGLFGQVRNKSLIRKPQLSWKSRKLLKGRRKLVPQLLHNTFGSTATYVLKDLGLGNKPYEQNVPESMNDMMKDWTKFVVQDMEGFIVTLYDFMQSFEQGEELAWFQLSDKWEVCHQFQEYLPRKSHAEMTPKE